MNVFEQRIKKALKIAEEYGGVDGAHHKDWVIDQMVRALTAHKYEQFVARVCNGDEGANTHSWEEGIAP